MPILTDSNAGNPQLTTSASVLQQVPTDNLLTTDLIRGGRHGLFSSY